MTAKILLVEDDVSLANAVQNTLMMAGYQPIVAYTAEDGLHAAFTQMPDLVLLDIMVPTSGGWEVCRRIREQSEVPIIFLTALGNTENIVYGLEVGADDYVVKPFEDAELLARIKAHLRRTKSVTPHRLVFGSDQIIIDVHGRSVIVRGELVDLTPREYDLLVVLATNAGRVVPVAELVEVAWGMTDEAATENVKPYIHYLRKKIEVDSAAPQWIVTVRGVGYRFTEA